MQGESAASDEAGDVTCDNTGNANRAGKKNRGD
jgi:hypothetical protein